MSVDGTKQQAGGDTIKRHRILIVEQDEQLATDIAATLEQTGCEVTKVADVVAGLKTLYEAPPHLIIMARELPMVNGEDPVLLIRQASLLPIIVLGSQQETVEMLEIGADAYMTKPPSLVELVARVRSLLRRPTCNPLVDDSKLDTENEPRTRGLELSNPMATEYRLASCLVLNKGRLLEYFRHTSQESRGKGVKIERLHYYVLQLCKKFTNRW